MEKIPPKSRCGLEQILGRRQESKKLMEDPLHLNIGDMDNPDTPQNTPKKCASFLMGIRGQFDRKNARHSENYFSAKVKNIFLGKSPDKTNR
ncbi:MAG: hypothetical protein JWQ23_4641 [Herminiimonas sp.]|nr:hypothetical protein [Herminiimonas sp.]